jgi:YYY domain-containing protein
LIGQAPSIVFNTGISTFFGLTAVNLFGLSSNVIAWAKHARAHVRTSKDEPMEPASHSYPSLLKAVPFGLFSMIMCVIFGNLASAQQWIEDLKYPGFYDWFSPSRVIPNTINEFPAFSFLLSDFHAHVLTLAFTLLAMGVAFNLFLQHDGAGLNSFGHRWQIPFTLFVTALSMGQLFAMNGWDLPTYLGLALVAIAIQQWLSYERKFQLAYLVDVASAWMSLIALSFLLFLPFYANYIVPMGGIGVVQPQDRSAFNLELLIFGLFLFVFVSLLVACAWRRPLFAREPTEGEQERAFPSFLLLGGILVVALIDILVLLLLHNSVTFVVMGDIALCGAVLMFYHKEDRALAFTLLVGALAFALVASCEVFFMKDLFVNSYPRMNTVFKFYFQAWALLSVACGSGLYFILERFWRVDTIKVAILGRFKQGINVVWAGCLAVLVIASMIYPTVAPAARLSVYNPKTGKMQMTPTWSLDGLAYLKDCKPSDSYPSMDSDPSPFCQVNVTGDYYAIRWINANIKGDPIVVEAANAQDEDYSEYALVSSFTGLPTIMGWPGHEVQWRNGWLQNPANSASFDQRLTDINTIYTDPNPQVVLNLMHSYRAEYLYVGAMEYYQYLKSNPGANLHRFASFMQMVYNKDGAAIYKVK